MKYQTFLNKYIITKDVVLSLKNLIKQHKYLFLSKLSNNSNQI